VEHEVVLTGDRVSLRPFRHGDPVDAAFLREMAADPASRRWSRSLQRIHAAGDGGAAWLETRSAMPGTYEWLVEADGRAAGRVSLHRFGDDAETEVGYWTLPDVRGRGIARRAARLATQYGHADLGLDRIALTHAVANPASCRVALAASFRLEGTARASQDHGDGVALDMHVHARLAGDDWEPLPDLSVAPSPVDVAGDGVLLRAWRSSDAPAVAAAISDPQIARWNPVGVSGQRLAESATGQPEPPPATDGVLAWIEDVRAAGDAVTWAIVDPAAGTVAGKVSLFHLDAANGSAEAGYWVLAEHRGRGIGRRALAAAARYAFDVVGVQRVELFHAVDNPASCAVASGAGFDLEGTLRRSYRYGDGVLHDEHVHARLADPP
jgi:RimJ/RimL family protein N-acetyltransferase